MSQAPPSDHLLRTMAAVPVACRVLDLGCADGRHALPLAQLGFELWACDPSDAHVASTRALLAPVLSDAEAERRVTTARPAALGYPDAHFDWTVAYGSFDGASDATEAMEMLAEAMRVLRPGGWIFAAMSRRTDLTTDAFATLFAEAGFALAEEPAVDGDMVRGIFRRVEAGVGA